MKPIRWTRGILTACAVVATACGVDSTQPLNAPKLVEDLAGSPHSLRFSAAGPDAAACEAVDARLRAHRGDLAATPEWHDLADTPQWQQLTTAVRRAVEADCEFMAASATCVDLLARVRTAFGAVRATEAYAAAEATSEWQGLLQDYAGAKDNSCWNQRSDDDHGSGRAQDMNGPVNPSPNPAPNPTPVPPTNPDTGNTEPNGGQPNTSPEPSSGPINPSPSPAPNPTPVPPTNPSTGNTEG